MIKTHIWRPIVIGIVLLAALYYAWPSVQFWTMSPEEKEQLNQADPAEFFKRKQEAIRLGLDLQGGMHVVLRVQLEKLDENARKDATDRCEAIVRNRIDQFGVTEPLIQQSGNDRIIVDLPGFTDVHRAQKLIGEMARLEFKLLESFENTELLVGKIDKALAELNQTIESVAPKAKETEKKDSAGADSIDVLADLLGKDAADSAAGMAELTDEEKDMPFSIYLEPIPGALGPEWMVESDLVPNIKMMLDKPAVKQLIPSDVEFAWGTKPETSSGRSLQRLYLLKSRVQMSGEYLVDAVPEYDQFGKPQVNFRLTREGGRIFSRVTGPNIGKLLAIVLDGRVESAPQLKDRIRDVGTISMGSGSTYENARDLAIVLKAGAMPTDVEIIESSVVGPSLGRDSINRGLISAVIALGLVLLLMGIYYRVSGLIADFSLFFNIFLILSALAALRATLTMPGIAGIILTIGISVDAAVLVFERIREELRTGKTIRAAIDAGYERALVTITDSNVTTLFAASILFIFGSGPVKGFAITLFLGILISLFTTLVITRAIFEFRKQRQSLSI